MSKVILLICPNINKTIRLPHCDKWGWNSVMHFSKTLLGNFICKFLNKINKTLKQKWDKAAL